MGDHGNAQVIAKTFLGLSSGEQEYFLQEIIPKFAESIDGVSPEDGGRLQEKAVQAHKASPTNEAYLKAYSAEIEAWLENLPENSRSMVHVIVDSINRYGRPPHGPQDSEDLP